MTTIKRYGIRLVATLTALISVASWSYRYVDEHTPSNEIVLYILVPAVIWLLLLGPLLMLRLEKFALRVLAVVLLLPAVALWVLSVLVGIYGLKIH